MKRQQAKELLPIIQAFAEGKTIQYYYTKPTPHWEDVLPNQNVDFINHPSKYRIKPEPEYHPSKDGDIMMTMDERAFICNGIIDSDRRCTSSNK